MEGRAEQIQQLYSKARLSANIANLPAGGCWFRPLAFYFFFPKYVRSLGLSEALFK